MELCDDKNVIKVTVEGDKKTYSAYGKYYMRSADKDREISPQQLLQQIMVQLDYIEQTGHGVPLIVSKFGKRSV